MRERHLDPPSGFDPLMGRFVAMAVDARQRLHRDLEDLRPEEVDATPSGGPNSIGTLLYLIRREFAGTGELEVPI